MVQREEGSETAEERVVVDTRRKRKQRRQTAKL